MTEFIVTQENFQSIRENGIGNGFTVLNPADGFRKDGRLWFGTCSECGESVTNSIFNGYWEHSVITKITENHTRTQHFPYCLKTRKDI